MKLYKPSLFKKFVSPILVAIFAQLLLINIVFAETCQLSNEFLDAMPKGELVVNNSADETLTFEVKMALNNQTRAAGFQYVCAETIAAESILFVFDRPRTPSFHMYNVVASIDIAFIDSEGRVESIQSMFPYIVISKDRPLYSPKREVVAALEAYPGFYKEHGIEVGDLLTWQLLEPEH